MKLLKITVLFLVFVLLDSCDFFLSEDSKKLEPLESNIFFSITHDSSELIESYSGCVILLKTEKIYAYSYYLIKTDIEIDANIINIKILGIDNKQAYLTGEHPAIAKIPINVQDNGYTVNFKYKSALDKYSILISDTTFSVVPIDTNFVFYEEYYNGYF